MTFMLMMLLLTTDPMSLLKSTAPEPNIPVSQTLTLHPQDSVFPDGAGCLWPFVYQRAYVLVCK